MQILGMMVFRFHMNQCVCARSLLRCKMPFLSSIVQCFSDRDRHAVDGSIGSLSSHPPHPSSAHRRTSAQIPSLAGGKSVANDTALANIPVPKRAVLRSHRRSQVAGKNTHLPPPRVPGEAPRPPRPALVIVHPPPETEQLAETYIRERAVGQIAVPLVLHLGDFARRLVVEDVDLAGDGLLFADALDDVAGLEIQADGVASIGDFVTQPLDFFEGRLQAVLLLLLAGKAFRYGGLLTHWGSYCLRPVATVIGSSKTPSSSHSESFFSEGRPAKSCLTISDLLGADT